MYSIAKAFSGGLIFRRSIFGGSSSQPLDIMRMDPLRWYSYVCLVEEEIICKKQP